MNTKNKLCTKILVKTSVEPINAGSPYGTFKAIRREFGKKAFILESLDGPTRDKKNSIIGINPVLTIKVKGKHLSIEGDFTALLDQLNKVFVDSGATVGVENYTYHLREASEVWDLINKLQNTFELQSEIPPTTFAFGFLAYFGYDAVFAIEKMKMTIEEKDIAPPDMMFSIYQYLISWDLVSNECLLISNEIGSFVKDNLSDQIKNNVRLTQTEQLDEGHLPPAPKPDLVQMRIKKQDYFSKVEKALEYIGMGDIYQVQLGHDIQITSKLDPLDLYQRLRVLNSSPYMYYAHFGDQTIVGASPELFIQIVNNEVMMRPIAGTCIRAKDAAENQKLKDALLVNEKEIAEHVMLVDLCRNDIGRICKTDTLKTSDLMIVEEYSHVNHIVSTVVGELREDVNTYDAFKATFPAGTMTGAPKIRAMEIIEELEDSRRGVYSGALGLIGFNGFVNTALCIRTAIYKDKVYNIRASAGIVADSEPEAEWRETLSKLGASYLAITGKELRDERFVN